MSDATQWTSLLLQKQGMQAQADEEQNRVNLAQMRDFLNSGMGAANEIQGAMSKAKLDSIANSLMEQDPAGAGIPEGGQSLGGGADELKIRQMLDNNRNQAIAAKLRQQDASQMMDLRQQQAASLDAYRQQQMDLRERQEARAAFDSGSKKLREATLDANATFKNLAVMSKALGSAQSQEEYDGIFGQMAAMVSGAQAAGVPNIVMPKVAPFVPPSQRIDAGAAAAASAMRSNGLSSMPGYSLSREYEPTPSASAPIIYNDKGEKMILQGNQWVPLK